MTYKYHEMADWAWELPLPMRAKHLLLCYVKHADKDGKCHPGLRRLATLTDLHQGRIVSLNRALAAAGLITITPGGPHRPNRCQLHVGAGVKTAFKVPPRDRCAGRRWERKNRPDLYDRPIIATVTEAGARAPNVHLRAQDDVGTAAQDDVGSRTAHGLPKELLKELPNNALKSVGAELRSAPKPKFFLVEEPAQASQHSTGAGSQTTSTSEHRQKENGGGARSRPRDDGLPWWVDYAMANGARQRGYDPADIVAIMEEDRETFGLRPFDRSAAWRGRWFARLEALDRGHTGYTESYIEELMDEEAPF